MCIYTVCIKCPARRPFRFDDRVRLQYLLHDTPNREEWKAAARKFAVVQFIKRELSQCQDTHREEACGHKNGQGRQGWCAHLHPA